MEQLSIDNKYADTLKKLAAMPVEKASFPKKSGKRTEQKESDRENFIKSSVNWDEFAEDVLMELAPGLLNFYDGRYSSTKHEDDAVAAAIVIKEAIRRYDGRQNTSFIGFLRYLYARKRNEDKETENLAMKTHGLSESLSKDLQCKVGKLIRKYAELLEQKKYSEEDIEQLFAEIKQTGISKENFLKLFRMYKSSFSLDFQTENEDGDRSKSEEKVADDYFNPEKSLMAKSSFKVIVEGWEYVCNIVKLTGREYIRIFSTKHIMEELKLDQYDRPYKNEPAGNLDIYDALKPYEAALYGGIFQKKYLYSLFDEERYKDNPDQLYKAYKWLLKQEIDLRTDKTIELVMQISKSTVSKKRKIYEEQFLPELKALVGD